MTKSHHTERLLPFSPRQLYDLVEDVQHYPEFIPWCVAARIRKREPNYQLADLIIGFKLIKETFSSHVRSDPDAMVIRSEAEKGPFKHLTNVWTFLPDPQGRPDYCLVQLAIEFEFANKVLQRLIETMFEEAQKRMVSAFEQRAHTLYGSSANRAAVSPDAASPTA